MTEKELVKENERLSKYVIELKEQRNKLQQAIKDINDYLDDGDFKEACYIIEDCIKEQSNTLKKENSNF
jgi:predicted transcriptional regulator